MPAAIFAARCGQPSMSRAYDGVDPAHFAHVAGAVSETPLGSRLLPFIAAVLVVGIAALLLVFRSVAIPLTRKGERAK